MVGRCWISRFPKIWEWSQQVYQQQPYKRNYHKQQCCYFHGCFVNFAQYKIEVRYPCQRRNSTQRAQISHQIWSFFSGAPNCLLRIPWMAQWNQWNKVYFIDETYQLAARYWYRIFITISIWLSATFSALIIALNAGSSIRYFSTDKNGKNLFIKPNIQR